MSTYLYSTCSLVHQNHRGEGKLHQILANWQGIVHQVLCRMHDNWGCHFCVTCFFCNRRIRQTYPEHCTLEREVNHTGNQLASSYFIIFQYFQWHHFNIFQHISTFTVRPRWNFELQVDEADWDGLSGTPNFHVLCLKVFLSDIRYIYIYEYRSKGPCRECCWRWLSCYWWLVWRKFLLGVGESSFPRMFLAKDKLF